jgi:hypothetical protein
MWVWDIPDPNVRFRACPRWDSSHVVRRIVTLAAIGLAAFGLAGCGHHKPKVRAPHLPPPQATTGPSGAGLGPETTTRATTTTP